MLVICGGGAGVKKFRSGGTARSFGGSENLFGEQRNIYWGVTKIFRVGKTFLGMYVATNFGKEQPSILGGGVAKVFGVKGPFTLSLAIVIPKSDSLAIVMFAKKMAYPTHSLAKSLAKICLFPQA